MSRREVVLCGVPEIYCTGGKLVTDQNQLSSKCHTSSVDAFRCHKRYLIDVLGFTPVGPRELINPENGRVRVLTKQTRFGARMRTGKEGARFQPKRGCGVVIG